MTDTARLAMIDAAKLLGRKEYSQAEMRGLLSSRHPESATTAAIELLGVTGMLSGVPGGSSRRGTGYGELKNRLTAKGVDKYLVDILLESDLAAEIEKAKGIVRANIPAEKDKEKVARFLEFRGIDKSVVQALIERIA